MNTPSPHIPGVSIWGYPHDPISPSPSPHLSIPGYPLPSGTRIWGLGGVQKGVHMVSIPPKWGPKWGPNMAISGPNQGFGQL